MVFLVYREGMQLPLVAMVLREASALMRTSSNNNNNNIQITAVAFLPLTRSCLLLNLIAPNMISGPGLRKPG